jgi:hypothetical protein
MRLYHTPELLSSLSKPVFHCHSCSPKYVARLWTGRTKGGPGSLAMARRKRRGTTCSCHLPCQLPRREISASMVACTVASPPKEPDILGYYCPIGGRHNLLRRNLTGRDLDKLKRVAPRVVAALAREGREAGQRQLGGSLKKPWSAGHPSTPRDGAELGGPWQGCESSLSCFWVSLCWAESLLWGGESN